MNDIIITKGNTKDITIIVKANGIKVPLVNGDSITMSVKKQPNQTTFDIQKVITSFINGEAIIRLTTQDTTIDLGKYKYDIQFNKANGEVFTILKGNLDITQGVTQ